MRLSLSIILLSAVACSSEAPAANGALDGASVAADSGLVDLDAIAGADDAAASGLPDALVASPDATVTSSGADASFPAAGDAASSSRPDVAVPGADDAAIVANDDAAVPAQPDAAGTGDGAITTDAGNICTRAGDCIAGAEVCGRLVVENNTIVTRCGPPNSFAPARLIGEQCGGDLDCGSGLCLDGLANECSQVCTDAATDCPPGYGCVAYPYNPGDVWIPVCNRTCGDDADCVTPGTLCSTQSYLDRALAWQLTTVCQATAGATALGVTCAVGSDCQSGICFTNTRAGVGCAACANGEVCQGTDCVLKACTSVCDDAADCAAGGQLTRCAPNVNFGLPDGTSRPVSVCGRP